MRFRLLLLSAALLSGWIEGRAQSSPDCPTHPANLEAMRHCYRPLLVFAPTTADPRLTRQQTWLDQAADDMMDRNVLYLPVVTSAKNFHAPLDAPYVLLDGLELVSLRRRFHIAPDAFEVVLLGEDGGAKLRSSGPVPIAKLNALIDSMPMRQREMQRPHTN